MGGPGSTRWHGHVKQRLVEDCRRISIDQIRDNLYVGCPPVLCLSYDVDGQSTYGWTVRNCHTEEAKRHYIRWFWVCPDCQQRTKHLYLPPGSMHLACRKCHNLAYWCQHHKRKRNWLYSIMYPTPEAVKKAYDKARASVLSDLGLE